MLHGSVIKEKKHNHVYFTRKILTIKKLNKTYYFKKILIHS